jgi:hypothetical protein
MRGAAVCAAAAAAALPGFAAAYGPGGCGSGDPFVWGTAIASQPPIAISADPDVAPCLLSCVDRVSFLGIPGDIANLRQTCASPATPLRFEFQGIVLTGELKSAMAQIPFPYSFLANVSTFTSSLNGIKSSNMITSLHLPNSKLTGTMADNFAGWGSSIEELVLDGVTTITGTLGELQTALATGGPNLRFISWTNNGKGTTNGCFDSAALFRARDANKLGEIATVLLDDGQKCAPTPEPTLQPITQNPSTAYPSEPPSTFAPVISTPSPSRNPTLKPTIEEPTVPPPTKPKAPTPRTLAPGTSSASSLGSTLVALVASAALYL